MEDRKETSNPIVQLNKTRTLVLTSLLFAIAIILSVVENSLPPILVGVPGVKLGLSNIAVMYTLFFLTKRQAFMVAVLKSAFVFMTRGAVAAALSLTGGMLSLLVMIVFLYVFRDRISYLVLSIFGAVFHNVGQLVAISVLFTSLYIWAYLPVLLVTGVAAGVATSTLLKFVLPAFQKVGLQ